jgi:hypothetical protein
MKSDVLVRHKDGLVYLEYVSEEIVDSEDGCSEQECELEVIVKDGKIQEVWDGDIATFVIDDKEASDFSSARKAMAMFAEYTEFYEKVRSFVPRLWTIKQAQKFMRDYRINEIDEQIRIHLKQLTELRRQRKKL